MMEGIGTGTILLTTLSWLGAMLMSGLMTAHYRVSGLHRNGLLDEDSLGTMVSGYLAHERRFQVTTGTIYLVTTLLGAFGWGRLLSGMWPGALTPTFYVLFGVSAFLAWSLGAKLHVQQVAERSLAAGIEGVAFDRSGFKYHGRIKALADAAREAGVTLPALDDSGLQQLAAGLLAELLRHPARDGVLPITLSPAVHLPALVFVLAAGTAFATGSSWGSMGILVPLVVPLAWAVMSVNGMTDAGDMHILYSSVSCVLAGAVWGDHCSPISDTS